jgi:hypothetical protein
MILLSWVCCSCRFRDAVRVDFEMLLRRSMIEKYSSKSIDDKRLISIKFNLIYWSEYWLFDVFQLTNIEIYLYFTIYEMINFDVELDSYLSRFHVVKWTSRNKTFHESFNKTFVLRSFAHFWLVRWRFEHNRWIDEFDWSKISWDYQANLLDLRKAIRWLKITYSYSRRKRDMIFLFKDYCFNN